MEEQDNSTAWLNKYKADYLSVLLRQHNAFSLLADINPDDHPAWYHYGGILVDRDIVELRFKSTHGNGAFYLRITVDDATKLDLMEPGDIRNFFLELSLDYRLASAGL